MISNQDGPFTVRKGQPAPFRLDHDQEEQRNYLEEAKAILAAGKSFLLPEWQHLRAMEDAHQSEICRIVHEVELLMQQVLRRN